MAFFEKLRRAFGLDYSADYDDEIEGIDATVTPLRQRREEQAAAREAALRESAIHTAPDTADTTHSHPAVTAATGPDTTQAEEKADSPAEIPMTAKAVAAPALDLTDDENGRAVPAVIFRTVVEIFNRSLPDFLGSTVDTARQEQYLYDALEKGMKGYLDSLQVRAQRQYMEQRQSDMLKMEAELHQLREGIRQREEEAADTKKLQLSAERQKRALTERVHDLEKQVAQLEAEAEQYDLENKSLVNKLRLANLQEKNIETARADEEERQAELEALRAENRRLADDLEQLTLKESLGQTMVNDFQARASEAAKVLADKEQAMLEATADFNRRLQESDSELAAVRLELSAATRRAAAAEQATERASATTEELRIKLEEYLADRQEAQSAAASLQTQLDKAREKLSVIAEIQQQVEKLEEESLKADAVIRRHKDELMEKDELLKTKDSDLRDKNMSLAQKDALIKRLEDQTDSLRRQLEDAAYEKSQSESALRAEISRLKNLAVPPRGPMAEESAPVFGAGEATHETPAAPKADTEAAATSSAGAIDYMLDDLPIIEKDSSPKAKAVNDAPATAKAAEAEAEAATDERPRRQRRKPRSVIPPVDEPAPAAEPPAPEPESIIDDLDATDWLVSTPDPKKRPRRQEMTDNDDFGYHEPPRNTLPDNPAQMSLF